MNIQNLFIAIEDFEFGARVGVASGFETFGSIVCEQDEVKQLRDCCKDVSAYRQLYKRAVKVCNRPIDTDYANPWDIPLAVYLAIIQDCNFEEGKILARIVESTDNLFWARKVALAVLSQETKSQTDTSTDPDIEITATHNTTRIIYSLYFQRFKIIKKPSSIHDPTRITSLYHPSSQRDSLTIKAG